MMSYPFTVLRHGQASIKPSVLAIGNFDGVHRGHQSLIASLQTLAQPHDAAVSVLMFSPHPRAFFTPHEPPKLLMSWSQKIRLLKSYGVDQVIIRRFDQGYASLSPESFIHKELLGSLHVKAVLVGEDFRFGFKRQGSVETLKQAAGSLGFSTHVAKPILHDQQRISSTWLRDVLVSGDVALFQALTARPVQFSSVVVQGAGQGKKWGVPTANLALQYNPGWSGVFAARACVQGRQVMAAVSLGHRPVVGGGERLLEAHLIDFDGNLYGERLEITLLKKIRDQRAFQNEALLIAAMHDDIAAVRLLLKD